MLFPELENPSYVARHMTNTATGLQEDKPKAVHPDLFIGVLMLGGGWNSTSDLDCLRLSHSFCIDVTVLMIECLPRQSGPAYQNLRTYSGILDNSSISSKR